VNLDISLNKWAIKSIFKIGFQINVHAHVKIRIKYYLVSSILFTSQRPPICYLHDIFLLFYKKKKTSAITGTGNIIILDVLCLESQGHLLTTLFLIQSFYFFY
jgi:hypothetical protein